MSALGVVGLIIYLGGAAFFALHDGYKHGQTLRAGGSISSGDMALSALTALLWPWFLLYGIGRGWGER
jgi:hypothetical protein